MKKILKTAVLSAVVFIALITLASCGSKGEDLIVLYTNDVHCSIDGYSLLAEYAAELKARGENVVLADGGDFVQGTMLGIIDEGASVISIMNSVGYDFAVPGNHDYDYGTDVFLKNAGDSRFSFISCNFPGTQKEAAAFSHESVFLSEFGGHTVAFVGIEEVKNTADCISSVQNAVDEARGKGAQLVIAVGHTGGEPTRMLVESTDGIDIYLNAHDHVLSDGKDNRLSYTNASGQEVPVFETGTNLKYVCRLDIRMTSDGYNYSVEMKTPEDIRSEIGSAPSSQALEAFKETEQKIVSLKNQVEKQNRPVGTSECVLCVYDPVSFPQCNDYLEYNSSDFIADAFRNIAGTDIALINTNALRKGIQKGSVSKTDLCNLFPWFENVYAVDVTGQRILDILEHGTSTWPKYNPDQPAVSGLTFSVNTAADGDAGRVHDVKIGGRPLDTAATYTMASSAYYLFEAIPALVGKEVHECRCIGMDCDVVERYLAETLGGVIPASMYGSLPGDGRISISY